MMGALTSPLKIGLAALMWYPSRLMNRLEPESKPTPPKVSDKPPAHAGHHGHEVVPGWKIAAALMILYSCWSTTYLAIRIGVKDLPPFLFAGTRVTLAGLCLLGFLAISGGWRAAWMNRRDMAWTCVVGLFLFVGGNGLVTVAQRSIESGLAALLIATTPLWMALLESLWPGGERLHAAGWLGLALGMSGVGLLARGQQGEAGGMALVLCSACAWGVGSFIQRKLRLKGSPYLHAGWQMVFGGAATTVIGLFVGEVGRISSEAITPRAVGAFFYLLVVGSLIGFVAYIWLLKHVGTAVAGTYAYVNPVLAVILGALVDGEQVTPFMMAAVPLVLSSVALVRMKPKSGLAVASVPQKT
jgi:drug/metabolite transporter (DMT)-like permease